MPPFEIHVFSPVSTKPSPSRRAVISVLATSEPERGSDRAKAAMALPARVLSSHCFCSGVPNRLSAPAPSPCMAKAKSASPSWRASVSRARHSVRTSSGAGFAVSTAVGCSHPSRPNRSTSSRQAASTSAWATGRFFLHHASRLSAKARCRSSKNGHDRKERSGINSPRIPAFSCRRRRGRRVRNRGSACRSPAPAPRLRWPGRAPSTIPG